MWRVESMKIPKTTTKKGDECGEGEWTNTSLMVGRSEKVERAGADKGEVIETLTKRGCDHAASKGNGGEVKGKGVSVGRDQDG